jgi:rod shape-determining protein MreC
MKIGSLALLVPLLVALFCLSLPLRLNTSLRDQAAVSVSKLWQLMHKRATKSLPQERLCELEAWLQQHQSTRKKSRESAKRVLKDLSASFSKALIGEVLYRSEHTWNSSLWIDLGEDDNPKDGPILIAKNSPVLSGDSVIGVIDFCGRKTSLVRLISDSNLTIAVRAARGSIEDTAAIQHIQELADFVSDKKNCFQREEEMKAFLILLDTLKTNLGTENKTYLLAKGELQGHGTPFWRSTGALLRGTGFNYDYKDSYGPARDLRTGEPIDPDGEYKNSEKMALIQGGDILITSGMDGIFPEGLKVAKVETIEPLREGAYAYELTATPTAVDLMNIRSVIVLPPQGFDPSDEPSRTDKIVQEITSAQ